MKLYPICINTFRETVRDRILYNLLAFALLMIGSTVYLATLTIAEHVKIVTDFGLAAISLFSVIVAIFVGIGLVFKELDKRTIYTVLSKPITRYEFVLGKYLGLLLTLLVNLVIMATGFILILRLFGDVLTPSLFWAIYFIYLELMVITALTIFFSSFTTPTLSAMFTLGLFVIGHLSLDLKLLGAKSESLMVRNLSKFIYYFLPNLENFNLKGAVVYQMSVSPERILVVTGYGLFYVLLLMLLAIVIFQRRDFK
jgi:ABC-type transport system involved in multi-copper enzyme maturation permease subunit